MADRDYRDEYDDADDDYLPFDGQEERGGGGRGPLIVAAVVVVLALCGFILWQLYSGGRDDGAPPVIAAETGPAKTVPTDPGGTAPPDGNSAFDAANGASAPPLTIQADGGPEGPVLNDGSAASAAPPASKNPPPSASVPAPRPSQAAASRPASPAPKGQTPAASPQTKSPAKADPARANATRPATVPARTTEAQPTAKIGTAASPASGGTAVSAQLGSFPQRSTADAALARYRSMGLSGPVSVVTVDLGAKGVWHRIVATGFANRAEAQQFCATARSAGAQCLPVGGR